MVEYNKSPLTNPGISVLLGTFQTTKTPRHRSTTMNQRSFAVRQGTRISIFLLGSQNLDKPKSMSFKSSPAMISKFVCLIGIEMDQYKVGPKTSYKWRDMGPL